jgi:hypothetical protein
LLVLFYIEFFVSEQQSTDCYLIDWILKISNWMKQQLTDCYLIEYLTSVK